jgi:N-acetylglucosamine kinase-like BadF-type ATPase
LHQVRAVVAGITGLTGDSPEAAVAAGILAQALAVPPECVRVEDDLWIGYHAAFRPGEGHVVYAGTGSVGMHLYADGRILRVGGRGMLIDDAGSAFWIGRQALDLVFRRIDDGAPPGALGEALFAAIGGSDWNVVRAHVYGGGRHAVAILARAVAEAAQGGDVAAQAILHEAGRELARLALALCRRAGDLPVVLLGRAASLHPGIEQGFRAGAPDIDMRRMDADAASAAARVAANIVAASCGDGVPGAG